MRKIFESPLPQVNGESRLSEYLQLWGLMTRCWAVDPLQRPTSAMCKTTFEYLPHCPPAPKTADPHARSAILLENLGDLESWKGNHKAGYAYLEQALRLYEEEGNDKGIASTLLKQAAVAFRDSDHVKTMAAASAALGKCRSLHDDIGIADALFWMGSSFLMDEKTVEALPTLQESLKTFRAKGNDPGVAKCLGGLGELYRRRGQAAGALPILEEAVDLVARCGDSLGEARALIVLGSTHRDLNRMDLATSTYQRAFDTARRIGWEPGVSTCLYRLGLVKLGQGRHGEADELLRESVRVARNSDAGWRLGQALWHWAKCLRAQGRHEEAISALEESCSVWQNLARSFSPELAFAAGLLADSNSTLDHKEEAIAWYDTAIAEWRKGGYMYKGRLSRCLASKDAIVAEMKLRGEGALRDAASS
ncbi:hypothetical protein M407DRAFT_25867 [Tulasnella calospora MUT 4182]|uniref:Tetratricopeptide repeat protein 29 n=1 Tax=Tulasnella calospora MUT 4182 TaxID=1051891 RepID=A0A0C3QF81_9AGAM|nr:hypothetical protein M407DRAFT_25867 [Tulasnella calospora MUT 4182]